MKSMRQIRSQDKKRSSIFVALPRERWEPIGLGRCACHECTVHGAESVWDTLVVRLPTRKNPEASDFTSTCHFPAFSQPIRRCDGCEKIYVRKGGNHGK